MVGMFSDQISEIVVTAQRFLCGHLPPSLCRPDLSTTERP